MALPALSLTVLDPGVGLAPAIATGCAVVGPSSAGTVDTLVSVATQQDVVDEFGEGPMPEDACRILSEAGGPIYCMRSNASVAGAAGAVSKSAAGSGTGTITVAGAAYDAYEAVVTITTSGDLGAAQFTYSLDGGLTTTAPITVPSGGSYVVPRTNLTLTFVKGGGPVYYEAGDVHTFTCTMPGVNATDLGTAMTALLADSRTWRFALLSGRLSTASAAATIAAAYATDAADAATAFRYVRLLMSGGLENAATTESAFAAFADKRVSVGFGGVRRASLKPFPGWGFPLRDASAEVAARCAASLISTHAGRVASGPLPGITSLSHDEYLSPGMDAAGFATLRTWPNVAGFYPTRGRIKAPAGSDFQRLELGFVMDVACTTVVAALTQQANKTVRVLTDGSGNIDPRDAEAWRQVALRPLRAALTEPMNAEGVRGHVSGLDVTIDQTNNVLTSGVVNVNVALVPLGYVETIPIQVGYANSL